MSQQSPRDNAIDYQIQIVNYDQSQALDIKPLVAEVNVYQDIFNNNIKLDLLISDGIGLIERFPVVGDEKIIIKMKTARERKSRKYVFDVYKITDRQAVEERLHGYVIHGITPQGIQNFVKNTKKAYVNDMISNIVKDVFDEYLSEAGDKTIDVEQTEGTYSVIATGQTPIEFINKLSKEAQSLHYNQSAYVFYEDDDNFQFRTIGSLYDKNIVERFYLADPSDENLRNNRDAIKSYQSIIGIYFPTTFNTLDGMIDGIYKNQVDYIDPVLRRFESSTFDYDKDFDKLPHVARGKKYLSSQGSIAKGEGNSHRRMLVTQISENAYNTETYINGKTENDILLNSPRVRHKFLSTAISELHNTEQYTVDVTVPGNTNLTVGQLISIFVPQPSDAKEDETKYLKMFGQEATFLITALKHTYKATDDIFVTVLSCTKESFAKDIRSELRSRG